MIPLGTPQMTRLHFPVKFCTCGMLLSISGLTGRAGPWLLYQEILSQWPACHISPALQQSPAQSPICFSSYLFQKCSKSMYAFSWYGLEAAGMWGSLTHTIQRKREVNNTGNNTAVKSKENLVFIPQASNSEKIAKTSNLAIRRVDKWVSLTISR